MGFLQRSDGTPLNMNKVTVSLWFYIPSAAITAAAAKFGSNAGFGYWNGVIPLLTWGAQTSGTQYVIDTVLLGNEPGIGDIYGQAVGVDYDNPQGPSYIGIRCDGMTANLEVLIQTGNPADCSNTKSIATGYILGPGENPSTYDLTLEDASYVDEGYHDSFGKSSDTTITPDAWHHLVYCHDVAGGSSSTGEAGGGSFEDNVTASSLMYAALDGVNLTGYDLPMIWPGGDFDENRHVSNVAANFAGVPDTGLGIPGVTLTVGTIPSSPLSIPGPGPIDFAVGSVGTPPEEDDAVIRIAMAELQIFTGIALDTSVPENVLAFRDVDGKPTSPSLAAGVMGKNPEVYFELGADWTGAVNRGTADGTWFKTGTVSDFTPTP